jgi:hypothetical protein
MCSVSVLTVVLLSGCSSNKRADSIPAVVDNSALKAWSQGDGDVVLKFRDQTRILVARPPAGSADCLAWTRSHLEPLGPTDLLFGAMSSAPDQPTAELALQHVNVALRWLAACSQEKPGPAISEVKDSGDALDARLKDLK